MIDDHFTAACFTQIWGYRNPSKINIELLDRSFKMKMSIATISMDRYIPPSAITFIDVLDPGDADPMILVVLTSGIEYRINPKTRTIITTEGVKS